MLEDIEDKGNGSDVGHLARLVALLEPPPKEFVVRSYVALKHFDKYGKEHLCAEISFASVLC